MNGLTIINGFHGDGKGISFCILFPSRHLHPERHTRITARRRDFFEVPNQTFMEFLKSIKYLANNFNSAAEGIFAH